MTEATSLVCILVALTLLLAIRLVTRKRLPKGEDLSHSHKFELLVGNIFDLPIGVRLPPGPPGRLILGNLTDMPTQYGWKTYAEWAKKYGN
jgi:hypothetical protein